MASRSFRSKPRRLAAIASAARMISPISLLFLLRSIKIFTASSAPSSTALGKSKKLQQNPPLPNFRWHDYVGICMPSILACGPMPKSSASLGASPGFTSSAERIEDIEKSLHRRGSDLLTLSGDSFCNGLSFPFDFSGSVLAEVLFASCHISSSYILGFTAL